ncbi:MAG: FtsX-like permease family protein [Actinomycetota bacterium]
MKLSRWRLAVRFARRDLRRNKGRHALVLAMVGIPVLLVTAFTTLYATADVTPREGIPREMGQTQARIEPGDGRPITQGPDRLASVSSEEGAGTSESEEVNTGEKQTASQLKATIQRITGGKVIPVATRASSMRTQNGQIAIDVAGINANDPQLAEFAVLTSGRFPRANDEVVISPYIEDRGYQIGSSFVTPGGTVQVVGIGEVPSLSSERIAIVMPESPVFVAATKDLKNVEAARNDFFLVANAAPVTLPKIQELNKFGLYVTSKEVIENPPAEWDSAANQPGAPAESNTDDMAFIGIAVMSVMLEVILLAGPAFAVAARRQERDLAMLAAIGGTRRDVRRVMFAQGIVSGGIAAIAAGLLGIPVGWLVINIINRYSPRIRDLTPFDVHTPALVAAMALGAITALAAALFPAWTASRQDPARVLAGRRNRLRTRAGLPIVGVVLLIAGSACTVIMATRRGQEIALFAGMLAAVLGAIATLPALIALVGRQSTKLPLPLRLAARDSARQRGRTAPAVAAVMAAVAGATTVAIGIGSYDTMEKRKYQPTLIDGANSIGFRAGAVDVGSQGANGVTPWTDISGIVRSVAPDQEIFPVGTLRPNDQKDRWRSVYIPAPGCPENPEESAPERCYASSNSHNYSIYRDPIVADLNALRVLRLPVNKEQRVTLENGGALVSDPKLIRPDGTIRIVISDDTESDSQILSESSVPAMVMPKTQDIAGIANYPSPVVITPETAERIKFPWLESWALLPPFKTPLTDNQMGQIEEKLGDIHPAFLSNYDGAFFGLYTERGYQSPLGIVILALAGIAAIAVLVGTFTATGLALIEARPDFATLAAIGAKQRTRRIMAAAQAVVIGLLGTITGIVVGFAPGIALTWPVTASVSEETGKYGTPVIDIPWLVLLGVGIGVPLLAAVVTGLFTRSRMPMTRRLAR